MSSKPVAPPAAPTTESYRPISPLAIIGLGVALVSNVIFLIDVVWVLLLLTIPALLIALLARRRIRRSEGTLAGEMVASAGIVFSLISGLGWTTKHFTTWAIVNYESSRFVNQWFEKLRDGKSAEAFLDTIDPSNRLPFEGDLQPVRNGYPRQNNLSPYDAFCAGQLPEMMMRYGSEAQWEHRGIQEWYYYQESYVVVQRYAVTTPEMTAEYDIHLSSQKNRDSTGPARGWKYNGAQQVSKQLTPYGIELQKARKEAGDTLAAWNQMISLGAQSDALRLVLTPQEQRDVVLSSLGCLLATPDSAAPAASALAASTSWASSPTAGPKLARFGNLYQTLRGPVVPGSAALAPKVVWLGKKRSDDKQGGEWNLDFSSVVEGLPREVEFELLLTLRGGDPAKPFPRWSIAGFDYRRMGETKRIPRPGDPEGSGYEGSASKPQPSKP